MVWLYMQGLHIVLNMAEYTSKMTEYTPICLNAPINMPEHG